MQISLQDKTVDLIGVTSSNSFLSPLDRSHIFNFISMFNYKEAMCELLIDNVGNLIVIIGYTNM